MVLAVTAPGDLDEGQLTLLAALDTSGLQVMASYEWGGRGKVLAITERGDLDEGSPWSRATLDTSTLPVLVKSFTFSAFVRFS